MLNTATKILDLLSPRERRRGFLLLGMILVMALLETVGVASIVPFLAVLTDPLLTEQQPLLSWTYERLGFADVRSFQLFLGSLMFAAVTISVAFKAFTTYALLRFTHMRSHSLGKRLVEGYLRQPYEWFLNHHTADIGKAVLSEVQQVVSGAVVPMMQLIAHGAVAACLLLLLVLVDPVLAIVVAVSLGGAYALVYFLLRGFLGRIGTERLRANRERFTAVQEAFAGIKAVKAGGLERHFLRRFETPSLGFARRQAAMQMANQLPRFAFEAIAFGGILLIALYLLARADGVQRVLPILALYAFAGYRLMPALQQIYSQLAHLRFAAPALESIHRDLISVAPVESDDTAMAVALPLTLSAGVKLDEVTYCYPNAQRCAVSSLSIEIPARTTVGLVGSTGSGKTTTVDLILGLLECQEGEVRVDDVVITRHNRRSWQRTIGYVPQDIHLADDTIAANIAFGLSVADTNEEAVVHAARIADLHDFVMRELSAGYQTIIGERGVRLSGGQRQRIGIARALYHDPELLILDEATSSLDNLTEQAVMDAVRNLAHRKTIIVIAHRLSTVRDCDQIVMLEHGTAVGRGTFDELLEQNYKFRVMVGTALGKRPVK
jgi:ABC-type multidrug transport system fused ATPase/permease subunit